MQSARSLEGLPSELDHVRIPSGIRYAIFRHHQHVARVSTTWNSIFSDWLPRSGYQAADAPSFERYGPEFDGRTGEGGLEIWGPLQISRRSSGWFSGLGTPLF